VGKHLAGNGLDLRATKQVKAVEGCEIEKNSQFFRLQRFEQLFSFEKLKELLGFGDVH